MRIFLLGLFILVLSSGVHAYEPNQVIGTFMACKTESAIKEVADADKISKEKLQIAFRHQIEQKQCGAFPGPVPVQLVELIEDYVDFDGAKNEVWLIHNGYYIIALDPNSKSSFSV